MLEEKSRELPDFLDVPSDVQLKQPQGKVGIDRVQEGHYAKDGTWTGGRWLNGDETHQGRHVRLYDGRWSVQRVTLYRY